MICYFILNDCGLVFTQGDIDVMCERIALMIMKKYCGVIEDPGSTLIITCQNHCDDHIFLYQALKAASNTTDSASVKDSTMPPMEQPATVPTAEPNTNVAGTTNRQWFSVVVPIKNKHGLQGALNDRYLNGENHTVQCPIEGCGGL
jgi:hypothetical protein